MNFDRLTQKLKASAAQAAEAAANFHGFDEMAANDEYINSPDLNVASGNRPPRLKFNNNDTTSNETPAIQQQQQQQQQQHFDDESTLSTHSSLRASVTAVSHFTATTAVPQMNSLLLRSKTSSAEAFHNTTTTNNNAAKSTMGNYSSKKRHLVPLKVSVPERPSMLKQSILQGRGGPGGGGGQPIADDSDSLSRSSDDEDLRDDPILSLLQQEKESDNHKASSRTKDNSNYNDGSSNEGRTKHRFFQDLENRIAMPEQSSNFEVDSFFRQGPPSGDSSTLGVANPLKSLFSRAMTLPWKSSGPQASNINSRPTPFFSRLKESEDTTVDPLITDVTLISGSAILSADELFQLDRAVKQQKQSHPYFHFQLGPREAFILFTMVLAAFVYFMYRNPMLV